MASSLMVGESLVGDGNEVAHIDLLIGPKDGPVGEAFANALINQKEGHTNLLAVVAPNLPAKPDTIMANKVTIKGATQAVQMFGPAQAGSRARGRRRRARGHHPAGPGGRSLHHRRRLHPLGSGRRQEDLRLEPRGHEGVDRARDGRRAERRSRCSTAGRGAAPVRRREPRGRTARRTTRRSRASAGSTACAPSSRARAAASAPRSRRRSPAAGADRARHVPPQRGGARAVADGIGARRPRARRAGRPRHARGLRARSSPRRASALGGLDVWVNNAGADVLTGDAAGWDWERKLDLLLAVDLKGTIACSYAAGAVMREQPGGGAILNMSWDHVTSGMAGANPELFSAVKGGVLGLQQEPRARARAGGAGQRPVPGLDRDRVRRAGRRRGSARSVADATPLRRWGTPADVAARGAVPRLAGGGVRHRAGDQRQRRRCDVVDPVAEEATAMATGRSSSRTPTRRSRRRSPSTASTAGTSRAAGCGASTTPTAGRAR